MGAALGRRRSCSTARWWPSTSAGVPSFQLLQERMHVADRHTAARRAERPPAAYFAFDLLHLDGARPS